MTHQQRLTSFIAVGVSVLLATPLLGDEFQFTPAEKSQFTFDTGALHGRLSADGRRNGIVSLVHSQTREELAHGVGVLNLYRLFSSSTRYGDAARSWPVSTQLLNDGRVQVTYAKSDERPFAIRTVYHLPAANTLDLEIVVTPEQTLPQFELFQSSYFKPEMTGRIYVKPPFVAAGPPRFLSPDYHDMIAGTYLMFPRDEAAIRMIHDGRWRCPPHPVQWSICQWMAAPLALRTDPATGVTAVLMARPEDCFAVAAPYNRTPPDGIAAHGSLYFSLFGRDLVKSHPVRTRLRLVVLDQFETKLVAQAYQQFLTTNKK